MKIFIYSDEKTMPRYGIRLTVEEVSQLQAIIKKDSYTAQSFKIAYILLNCDEREYSDKATNEEIGKILKVSDHTIERTKQRFMEEGLDVVLERRPPTRVYDWKIDGDLEARLVRLYCNKPPEGRSQMVVKVIGGEDSRTRLRWQHSM